MKCKDLNIIECSGCVFQNNALQYVNIYNACIIAVIDYLMVDRYFDIQNQKKILYIITHYNEEHIVYLKHYINATSPQLNSTLETMLLLK